ncbi:universal stress protein [Streptomyces sp. NPDC001920]
MVRHVTAGVDGSAESLSAGHRAAREALRRGAPLRIVHALTETVTEGRAAGELVRASTGPALVVVGRRTRDGHFGVHIGPVAHAVLHPTGCPVAVVPHA